MIAYDRVVDIWRSNNLIVDERGHGVAAAQAPGHSAADRSVSFRQIEGQLLVNSHSDPTDHVLEHLGLAYADLFDSARGVDYRYSDGRVKHRSVEKRFSQSGATKGPGVLYRLDRLRDAPVVHWVEGEKDVHAVEAVGAVATTTASTSGALPDVSVLHGKTVVVWRDKDAAGRTYVEKIVAALGERANVVVVEARTGKDVADHVAAGHHLEDAVRVDRPKSINLPARRLVPLKASAVRIKRVRWTFEKWLVLGALNLLAGREGLGKSTLAVWIVAQLTRGTLPGELFGTPRFAIYLCTEDDPAFTVAPRLKAAGADMDRVIFLSVQTEYTDAGVVSLPGDMAELERVIQDFDVALVVLDAATSVMDSRLDGHDDRKVRQFLEPLAQSAGRLDYSVLGICHFGKRDGTDTGKLILGSVAWSQVARSVLAVAVNEESGDLVITNTKKNLAPETRSAAARIVSAVVQTDDGETKVGRIEWLGETDADARDLLQGTDEEDSTDRSTAEKWLTRYLSQSPGADSADVKKAARAADIAERTLQRARKKLGIVPRLEGSPPRSFWELPNYAKNAAVKPRARFGGTDGIDDAGGIDAGQSAEQCGTDGVHSHPCHLCQPHVHGLDGGIDGAGLAAPSVGTPRAVCAECSLPLDGAAKGLDLHPDCRRVRDGREVEHSRSELGGDAA